MRDKTDHKSAILVTCDAAVEAAARQEAAAMGDDVEHLDSCRVAIAVVITGCESDQFAIVDLETRPSGRRLLETAAGALPVLAITDRMRPWLSSMLRRRRIGAALVKPFSPKEWREAFRRVRKMNARVGRCWS